MSVNPSIGVSRYGAPGLAMLVLGSACIIAGGLVAAVTDPVDLSRGSWVSAYLVLVGGVAQVIFGWVPGTLGHPTTDTRGWAQLTLWNVGNAAVITATLASWSLGVTLGSILLVAALVLALVGWWGWRQRGLADWRWSTALSTGYVALIVLLAVSIPVGIVLSYLR